jgi:hypothetical protein
MSGMTGYTPKMPDPQVVTELSGMVAKNLLTKAFAPSMPDIHKTFNKMLGTFRETMKDNFEATEYIDKISISNEDAVNIFIEHVLPEYERLLEEGEDETTTEEVGGVSNSEINVEGIHSGDESIARGSGENS